MRITDRNQFRDLAQKGLCGNTPKIWTDMELCYAEIGKRTVFVTSNDPESDAFNFYHAKEPEIFGIVEDIKDLGYAISPNNATAPAASIYCMEVPARELQESVEVFQADLILSERYMLWNVSNQPWGRCKRAGHFREARELRQKTVLEHYLTGADIDALAEIEGKYPGCVIEFTKFPFPIGIYRTGPCIWEVRHY